MNNDFNTQYKLQVLYLAITDEPFLKSVQYFDGKKYFNDGGQWVWQNIVNHYTKYDELPSVAVLVETTKAIRDDVIKAAVNVTIDEIQKFVAHPPTNCQCVKDAFKKSVDVETFKRSVLEAVNLFETDPSAAKDYLLTSLQTTRSDNGPALKPITTFKRPEANDPSELIKHRFLCRGGAMMIIGASGIGKSVLQTQLAMSWALGRECLGLTPTRQLKSLVIQAEDDDGDLGEMSDSILKGMNIQANSTESDTLTDNVMVVSLNSASGDKFLTILNTYLAEFTPDIVWINPILSYLGGDSNSQKDVSAFLRNGLNPLLTKYNCACVVIHHSAKPPREAVKSGWSNTDFSYYGLGSVEWSNWARSVLTIIKTTNVNTYVLRAGKRGKRLMWTDSITGEPVIDKYISHSKENGILCWNITPKDEIEAVIMNTDRGATQTLNSILQSIPMDPNTITRTELMNRTSKSRNTINTYISRLVLSNQVKVTSQGLRISYSKPTTLSRKTII